RTGRTCTRSCRCAPARRPVADPRRSVHSWVAGRASWLQYVNGSRAAAARTRRPPRCGDRVGAGGAPCSRGRGGELEDDAVGVAERHAGTIRRVLDATACDAELVEAQVPRLELFAVSAAEAGVVETDAELPALLRRRRGAVLVQPEERPVPQQVHRVVH